MALTFVAGKSKRDQHKEEILALLKNGSTKTLVAKRYGSSLPNLFNWLKMNGSDAAAKKELPFEVLLTVPAC